MLNENDQKKHTSPRNSLSHSSLPQNGAKQTHNGYGKFSYSSRGLSCPICNDSKGKCRTPRLEPDKLWLCMSVHEQVFNSDYKYIGETADYLWGKHIRQDDNYERQFIPSKPKAALKTEPEVEPLDAREFDKLYRELIGELPLSQADVADLGRRGLNENELTTVKSLLFGFGEKRIKTVVKLPHNFPGTIPKPGNDLGRELISSSTGYAVPTFSLNSLINGYQVRNTSTDGRAKYKWGIGANKIKINKTYELPNSFVGDCLTSKNVYLCEGILKPLITNLKLEIPVIGGAGGNFGREQLREFLSCSKVGKLIILPDAGSISNQHVMRRLLATHNVLLELARELKREIEVKFLWWNQFEKRDGDIDEIDAIAFEQAAQLNANEFFALAETNRDLLIQELLTTSQDSQDSQANYKSYELVEVAGSATIRVIDNILNLPLSPSTTTLVVKDFDISLAKEFLIGDALGNIKEIEFDLGLKEGIIHDKKLMDSLTVASIRLEQYLSKRSLNQSDYEFVKELNNKQIKAKKEIKINAYVGGSVNTKLPLAELVAVKHRQKLSDFCRENGFNYKGSTGKYLPEINYKRNSIYFVIGDKGCGKTYQITKLADKKEIKEVIVIAPTINLNKQIANAVCASSINERMVGDSKLEKKALLNIIESCPRISLCINSLGKLKERIKKSIEAETPTLYIFEEIQSILEVLIESGNHMNPSQKAKAREVLELIFYHVIYSNSGASIVFADADISTETVELFAKAYSVLPEQITLYEHKSDSTGYPFSLLSSAEKLLIEIERAVLDNRQFVLASDSKDFVKILGKKYAHLKSKFIHINQDNCNTELNQIFLENPDSYLDGNSSLAYSPTMASGYDLKSTSPKIVFGHFVGAITSDNVRQMLMRLRDKSVERKIFITPKKPANRPKLLTYDLGFAQEFVAQSDRDLASSLGVKGWQERQKSLGDSLSAWQEFIAKRFVEQTFSYDYFKEQIIGRLKVLENCIELDREKEIEPPKIEGNFSPNFLKAKLLNLPLANLMSKVETLHFGSSNLVSREIKDRLKISTDTTNYNLLTEQDCLSYLEKKLGQLSDVQTAYWRKALLVKQLPSLEITLDLAFNYGTDASANIARKQAQKTQSVLGTSPSELSSMRLKSLQRELETESRDALLFSDYDSASNRQIQALKKLGVEKALWLFLNQWVSNLALEIDYNLALLSFYFWLRESQELIDFDFALFQKLLMIQISKIPDVPSSSLARQKRKNTKKQAEVINASRELELHQPKTLPTLVTFDKKISDLPELDCISRCFSKSLGYYSKALGLRHIRASKGKQYLNHHQRLKSIFRLLNIEIQEKEGITTISLPPNLLEIIEARFQFETEGIDSLSDREQKEHAVLSLLVEHGIESDSCNLVDLLAEGGITATSDDILNIKCYLKKLSDKGVDWREKISGMLKECDTNLITLANLRELSESQFDKFKSLKSLIHKASSLLEFLTNGYKKNKKERGREPSSHTTPIGLETEKVNRCLEAEKT